MAIHKRYLELSQVDRMAVDAAVGEMLNALSDYGVRVGSGDQVERIVEAVAAEVFARDPKNKGDA